MCAVTPRCEFQRSPTRSSPLRVSVDVYVALYGNTDGSLLSKTLFGTCRSSLLLYVRLKQFDQYHQPRTCPIGVIGVVATAWRCGFGRGAGAHNASDICCMGVGGKLDRMMQPFSGCIHSLAACFDPRAFNSLSRFRRPVDLKLVKAACQCQAWLFPVLVLCNGCASSLGVYNNSQHRFLPPTAQFTRGHTVCKMQGRVLPEAWSH